MDEDGQLADETASVERRVGSDSLHPSPFSSRRPSFVTVASCLLMGDHNILNVLAAAR